MSPGQYTDTELLELCRERYLRSQERDKQEAAIKDLSEKIGSEMAVRGMEKGEVGEFSLVMLRIQKEALDKKKLLEAGVTMEQLEKGVVQSGYNQLRVTKRQGI